MKEFIEKLIGRLEEISVSRDNDGIITGCNMGTCEDDDCLKCLKKKVISIINQLAEEYNNDYILVHTQGLDVGIRCAMCTNPMKSDRGCDGWCSVNEEMYKKVLDVIERHTHDAPYQPKGE